jgi:hypothetical protein
VFASKSVRSGIAMANSSPFATLNQGAPPMATPLSHDHQALVLADLRRLGHFAVLEARKSAALTAKVFTTGW